MTVVALIFVVLISALAMKAGAIALRMTGIDKEYASFQSLSAFTGTGFTTMEAENIVNHPQRRRVVKILMLFGNVGIISIIATLILSFKGGSISETVRNFGVIGLLIAVIVIFSLAKGLDNVIESFIEKRLRKMTHLSVSPVSSVMKLASGYGVAEIAITDTHAIAGKKLSESGLSRSGVLIFAIKRGLHLIPTPSAGETIEPGDRLVCFGLLRSISEIAELEKQEEQPA
jgi:hypothetical protein